MRTPSSQPIPAPGRIWSASELKRDPHAEPDKAERVQKMFAAIAKQYDLNNRLHSLGRDQAWRRRAVQLCHVLPGDDVLDVACGTGDLSFAFASAGPHTVTGLDFTEQMLEIARRKAGRNARSAIVPTFVQGDAMNLPFEDAAFDIVSIAFGIRNVADPARALREFRRVLRQNGRLIVLEFSQPRHPILRRLNSFYCGTVMPITATLIARDRSGAYRYLPRSVQTFPESEQFISLLKSDSGGGFGAVEAHRLTFGVCTAYLARP